jgi:hypothetical protein
MLCSKCGTANAEGTWFCAKCGTALAVQGAVEPAVASSASVGAAKAVQLNTAATDFDEDAWRAAIGPRNTDYYLTRFAARHAGAEAARWHWPAFFVTFYWLLYRKLWGWAVLYFVLPYAVALVLGLLAALAGQAGAALAGGLWIASIIGLFVVPPLIANPLYYARCKKLIERQRSVARSREHLLAQVEARGGTSVAVAIVLGVFVLIGLIGILAAIALPAYSDYTRRAKVAEALGLGRAVATQVGDYYERTGTLPASLEQLPQQLPSNRYVHGMRLDSSTGVIEIDVSFGGASGGSVFLVPNKGADGHVAWGCRAAAEMQRSVPATCRDP